MFALALAVLVAVATRLVVIAASRLEASYLEQFSPILIFYLFSLHNKHQSLQPYIHLLLQYLVFRQPLASPATDLDHGLPTGLKVLKLTNTSHIEPLGVSVDSVGLNRKGTPLIFPLAGCRPRLIPPFISVAS